MNEKENRMSEELFSEPYMDKLNDSLRVFLQSDGTLLNKEQELTILSNILELWDGIAYLDAVENEGIAVSYKDKLVELHKTLFEASKISSPLKIVINSVGDKLGKFLTRNGYLQEVTQRVKSPSEKLEALRIARLEALLKHASEELSISLRDIPTSKTYMELKKEKKETLQNKLSETANKLILLSFKEKT